MDSFSKRDIGKKVYIIVNDYVKNDGAVYVHLGVIKNVSLDGCIVRVQSTCSEDKECQTTVVAKSYEGLKSCFDSLIKTVEDDVKLMAYRRGLDGRCVCIVDSQVTDIYGDTRFSRQHNVNGQNPIWQYGTDKNKGLMTVDEVCAFINEQFKYPLGPIYTMDKATDNWSDCPHCGSKDTDLVDHECFPEFEQYEQYRCCSCGCEWVNNYKKLERQSRELVTN